MILDDIKQHIEEKELSFLIGAGFSKNISSKYPFWDELLSEAIWKMFGKGDRKRNEAEVKANAIRELGYLGIASRMVANSGFHETIDAYIEEHTPFLLNKGGKAVLRINGKELKDSLSFHCHDLLKNLEIQNIYTFNYDNALEFCLGDEKKKQLEKNKTNLEKKRIELVEKREELLRQIQELDDSEREKKDLSENNFGVSNNSEELEMKTAKEERANKQNELTKLDMQIAETESHIPVIQYELANYYQVVKDSSDISLTANRKNIYKIHGDLRESSQAKYGFDGDNHTQYIITKEDYDTYNDKHSAFVNLMRIDLLRNRFCIMGVSGGDANFLAWINWVKDVLDNGEGKKSQSYFIYSSDKEMNTSMQQMLNNHFICPVILKNIFPDAKTESERITQFLEYIQPFGHQRDHIVDLWKEVDIWGVRRLNAEPVDDKTITDLLDESENNRFHKQSSIVHYKAEQVQFAVKDFLQKPTNAKRLKIYASAMRCSMLPINLSCGLKGSLALEQTSDLEVRRTYTAAMRRARLLTNIVSSPQKEFLDDPYSAIMYELFNFTFPTEEKLASFPKATGLDYVRHLSLLRLIENNKALLEECKYNVFNSPQELVLAVDYLKSMSYVKDSLLSHKADEYKHQQPLFRLQDYFQSYLTAMHEKNEVQAYGSSVETIRMNGRDSGVTNAAVILNTFVELGVTISKGWYVSESDWIEMVKLLKEYYPYPLVFYTIARGGKDSFIKKVAQELMYSERCQTILPDLLVKLLTALKSKETPRFMMTPMAVFARSLFPATPKSKWKPCFVDSVDAYLEYADSSINDYDFQKALYLLVGDGLNYVNSKTLNLRLIERVLDKSSIDGDFDNHVNSLVVDAMRGLKAEDFQPLVEKYMTFARKADNGVKRFITMNLMSLLDNDHRHKLLKEIGTKIAADSYLTVVSAYYMKDDPDLATSFKEVFLKDSDFWKSGIGKDGSISIGAGSVAVSRVVDMLPFDEGQLQLLYQDMKVTLAKIGQMFKRPKHEMTDLGWMSEENIFRDIVTDMVLFVHKNEKHLSKEKDYATTLSTLSKIYHQCFFNKTILQMISDGKIYRSIKRLLTEAEIYGIEEYKMEYTMLLGKLHSKDCKEINACFRHLSWVLTKNKTFFNTSEFNTLISSVLDSYAQYYVEGNAREWDIMGCEKEVAEKHLVLISKTMKRWGHPHPFWDKYKKKYYLR